MSEADAEDDTPLVLDKPQKTEIPETIFVLVFFKARIPPQTSCGQKQIIHLKNFKKESAEILRKLLPQKPLSQNRVRGFISCFL